MQKNPLHQPAALAAVLAALSLQTSTWLDAAPLGTAFTYQGRLTDGGPPANGLYDLSFRLFDAPAGGTLQSISLGFPGWPVNNGLFTVPLDFGSNVFTGQALWLQIDVMTNNGAGYASFPQRHLLAPAPYALYAPKAGSADTVASNSVTAPGLSTPAPPTAGQVLTFNGANLVWDNPGAVVSGDLAARRLNIGLNHALTGELATIAGGQGNAASGATSTVGGGLTNRAGGAYSVVPGGRFNRALGDTTTVGGGLSNEATNDYATVAGGANNLASGARSVVGGGAHNRAYGDQATVGGGSQNYARSACTTVAGGYQNEAIEPGAFVGGGGWDGASVGGNTATGACATVSGGYGNLAGRPYATVAGGRWNSASGENAAIGGGFTNTVGRSAFSATIGGGEYNTIDSLSHYSTIAGGSGNSLSYFALLCAIGGGGGNGMGDNVKACSIGGGTDNIIRRMAEYSTIVGGHGNQVGDGSSYAVVVGGEHNLAWADHAFAAGRNAQALHQGAFVWADSVDAPFASTAANEVSFRCGGGVRFLSGASNQPLQTVSWTPGSGAWDFTSDRRTKERFQPVKSQDVLEKVSRLPISEWNYIGYPQRHIGPMAQDFHALFPLNENDAALNDADLHGVALAAIQGLNQKLLADVKEKEARIVALERRLAELEQLVRAQAR